MEVLNAPTKSCILRSEPTSGGNRWFVYTKVGPETPGITKNDFRHIYAIIKYQRRNINLVSLFQYLLLPNYMEFHAIKYGRFLLKGGCQPVSYVRDCTHQPSLSGGGGRAARAAEGIRMATAALRVSLPLRVRYSLWQKNNATSAPESKN